jgi:hypothetical protein
VEEEKSDSSKTDEGNLPIVAAHKLGMTGEVSELEKRDLASILLSQS